MSLSCPLDNAGLVPLSCILLDSGGWGTSVAGCNAIPVQVQAQVLGPKALYLLLEAPVIRGLSLCLVPL